VWQKSIFHVVQHKTCICAKTTTHKREGWSCARPGILLSMPRLLTLTLCNTPRAIARDTMAQQFIYCHVYASTPFDSHGTSFLCSENCRRRTPSARSARSVTRWQLNRTCAIAAVPEAPTPPRTMGTSIRRWPTYWSLGSWPSGRSRAVSGRPPASARNGCY
jgi:hypothetical protein